MTTNFISLRLVTAALTLLLCGTVHAACNPVDGASPGLGTLLRWIFGLYAL